MCVLFVPRVPLCADLIGVPEYRLWEECPDQPPCTTFHWAYADWVCKASRDCGPGIATRPARCVESSTKKAAANASLCYPGLLENVTKPCELEPCVTFYWRGNELADCGPEDPTLPCGRVSWPITAGWLHFCAVSCARAVFAACSPQHISLLTACTDCPWRHPWHQCQLHVECAQ
jgi:hypothetical protein